MALAALLADPATIAGTARSDSPKTSARPALLDATRSHRKAREERLQARPDRPLPRRPAPTRAARATPTLTPTLTPTRTPAPLPAPAPAPIARETKEGPDRWERRPIHAPQQSPIPAPLATPLAPPSERERALAAELREAQATLAIARETTRLQREDLARVRSDLARLESTGAAPRAEALAPPLLERLASLESALTQHADERRLLEERLARADQELALRTHQYGALELRFEVQSEALEQARRRFEQERRRHTDAQALLDRLRSALRGAEPDSTGIAEIAPASASADEDLALSPGATPASAVEPVSAPVGETPRIGRARPASFEAWREDQIRRHFGPLGIDTPVDLLRAPLERRAEQRKPLSILALGPGCADWGRRLAEDLVRRQVGEFVLELADPEAPIARRRADDDPLNQAVRHIDSPADADALAALLRERRPAAILTRDLLTHESVLEPWLAALDAARATGSALIFLEETGLAPIAPSPELLAIGERIWDLLPERYTRASNALPAVESFAAALAARPATPRNGLARLLRARFPLELIASFGCLAEAFVAGPIAPCFDPESASDRRFLKQIADLDERRLEAGGATPLHLVARVDPAAPR